MKAEGGPYIQAACFCDMVIEDKTGPLSLIRIVDTLTHTEAGSSPPKTMPPITQSLKLVVMLKSGMAQGRHELNIVPELPSAELKEPMTFSVHFEGEEKGQNIVVNVVFTFEFEGLYWFKVSLNDEMITAIPIRVRYNRVVTGV